MSAVWFRLRVELRSRWMSVVGLAVLVGLGGGVVMFAAAGARRTESAFPRLLETTRAPDVLANPDAGTMDFDAIEHLPQVAEAGRVAGVGVARVGPSGEPLLENEPGDQFAPMASLDGRAGFTIGRPKLVHGRMSRADRPDEVVLAASYAKRHGLKVGSHIPVISFTLEQLGAAEEGAQQQLPEGTPTTVTVVGIGDVFADSAVTDPDQRLEVMLLTPAFLNAYKPGELYTGSALRLKHGAADVAAYVAAAQKADGDGQVFYQTLPEAERKAQRAIRPYWGALGLFALVAGIAVALIVGQALARQLVLEASDYRILGALGMTTRQLLVATVARVALAAVGGAILASLLAVALSPLAPIGLARDVEPDPGVHVDMTVLALGSLAIVIVLLAVSAPSIWSVARTRAGSGGRQASSRLAAFVSRAFSSPSAAAGMSMALEPGKGSTAVPVRATIVGAAISLATLVTAITFGASLNHLVDTPRLYGAGWDATVDAGGGAEGLDMGALGTLIRSRSDVRVATAGAQGQVTVAGVPVPAIGTEGGVHAVTPVLLQGRAVQAPDEIVLGSGTLERARARVGSTVDVTVGDSTRRMRVVGRAVFPRFSAYSGADKTGLGDGAALSLPALQEFIPDAYVSFYLVRFTDGTHVPGAIRALRTAVVEQVHSEDLFVGAPRRPDDILGYDRVSRTPLVLAALLALVGGATAAHALVTTINRRRRDLAVFRTLGFMRGQVSATVAWQATTMALAAIIVALPIGVAAGRWVWTLLARQLNTVVEPATPLLAIAVIGPAALLLANVIAAVPARMASRREPALALRSE